MDKALSLDNIYLTTSLILTAHLHSARPFVCLVYKQQHNHSCWNVSRQWWRRIQERFCGTVLKIQSKVDDVKQPSWTSVVHVSYTDSIHRNQLSVVTAAWKADVICMTNRQTGFQVWCRIFINIPIPQKSLSKMNTKNKNAVTFLTSYT